MRPPDVRAEPLPVEDLLGRLEKVRPAGEGRWTGLCPGHGDKRPSLSVRLGDDGRILLHCFGGCTIQEIVGALGIEVRQLFPARDPAWQPTRPRRPTAEERARALFERLRMLRRPPSPERMRKELAAIGALLVGGTYEWDVPPDYGRRFGSHILRIIFYGMSELAAQGTPRRWFSPLAICRLIDGLPPGYAPGHGRALGIFAWSRMAVQVYRAGRAAKGKEGHG